MYCNLLEESECYCLFIDLFNQSFSHSTDIYWLKISICQVLSKHQGCKISRTLPTPLMISTSRPGSYLFQQTCKGEGERKSGTQKFVTIVNLFQKNDHTNCLLYTENGKNVLTFYFKNYEKRDVWLLLPGPSLSLWHLFIKPHRLILFQCAFPRGDLSSEIPLTSSSHPVLYQYHISSAKSFWVKNSLIIFSDLNHHPSHSNPSLFFSKSF